MLGDLTAELSNEDMFPYISAKMLSPFAEQCRPNDPSITADKLGLDERFVSFVVEPAADGKHLIFRTEEADAEGFDPAPDAKNAWTDFYNSVSEFETCSIPHLEDEGFMCIYPSFDDLYRDKSLSLAARNDACNKTLLAEAMEKDGLIERTGEVYILPSPDYPETESSPYLPRRYEKIRFTQKLYEMSASSLSSEEEARFDKVFDGGASVLSELDESLAALDEVSEEQDKERSI